MKKRQPERLQRGRKAKERKRASQALPLKVKKIKF